MHDGRWVSIRSWLTLKSVFHNLIFYTSFDSAHRNKFSLYTVAMATDELVIREVSRASTLLDKIHAILTLISR